MSDRVTVCKPTEELDRLRMWTDDAAAELTRLRAYLASAERHRAEEMEERHRLAREVIRLRADLAAAQAERDEAHNWSEAVERHGTDNFDALAEQWCAKDFIQRLIRAGSSVFAKWANDELTRRHHQLVSDIAHQAFVEGALCGVRAEMAKGAADLAAAQEREQRMREALERWAAAFKTGRNEPLVIAYEAARAAQENPND